MPPALPSSTVTPVHAHAPSLCILSPHRDDAAFSCGALLALAANAHVPITILNIFTRSAYAPFAPQSVPQQATTELRLSEDRAVTELLSPTTHLADLNLLDAPLRLNIPDTQVVSGPLDAEAKTAQLRLLQAALPDLSAARVVLIPLALGSHIDHILARDVALAALAPECLGFYQDLPYASRTASPTDLADETAGILEAANLATRTTFSPFLLRTDPDAVAKTQLLACYPSQVAPETVDEMSRWTAALGGELLYLSPTALTRLQDTLPTAQLTSATGHSPQT